jgi:hypothetical protein
MDAHRQNWNTRQKELRVLLSDPEKLAPAIQLFLRQHAEVHSRVISSEDGVSFEDEVLEGLTEKQLRQLPEREEHSIAWIIWHLARIEDITMSKLVDGEEQLFDRDGWADQLGVSIRDTGNAMSRDEVVDLNQRIRFDRLKEYRQAVGRSTWNIVDRLDADRITQKVSPSQLNEILEDGSVHADAHGLIEYWGRRTIAGLLLMPPTRHCFVHLNEADRIKKKLG